MFRFLGLPQDRYIVRINEFMLFYFAQVVKSPQPCPTQLSSPACGLIRHFGARTGPRKYVRTCRKLYYMKAHGKINGSLTWPGHVVWLWYLGVFRNDDRENKSGAGERITHLAFPDASPKADWWNSLQLQTDRLAQVLDSACKMIKAILNPQFNQKVQISDALMHIL